MRTRSIARTRRRFRFAAIALAAARLLCAPAVAVEKTLQNDSFTGVGDLVCIPGFESGDTGAWSATVP